MFKHGTVVIFIDRHDSENASLVDDATEILKRDGPVIAGCSHGDFSTIELDDGYVVTSHNPNLLTVHEGLIPDLNDLAIGLTIRGRRDEDSRDPEVIATSID